MLLLTISVTTFKSKVLTIVLPNKSTIHMRLIKSPSTLATLLLVLVMGCSSPQPNQNNNQMDALKSYKENLSKNKALVAQFIDAMKTQMSINSKP